MRLFVVIALLFLTAANAESSPRDLGDYSFSHYVKEFSKVYSSATLRTREVIFNTNLAKIKQINADFKSGRKTWFAAVNKFTDLTEQEMNRYKGFNKNIKSTGSALTLPPFNMADLPDSVDWRAKNVVSPVKNQGQCGSCWTFSTIAAVESHVAIKTGTLLTLSEQQIVSCATNPTKCGGQGGCEGATQELGFNYTRDAGGLATEDAYPYQGVDSPCNKTISPKATIDGYVRLDTNNATQLLAAIALQGPIAISVAASGAAFQFYGGGVAQGDCGWDVDHAVVAVGYGVDKGVGYWLVRNSWGPSWGEGGYIRVFRQIDGKTPEVCGTDSTPGDGDGCPNGPATITVCGECAILSDSSYPYGGRLI